MQIQMKNSIALSAKDIDRITGGADIDIIFGNVHTAPGSKPSHASNIDNQSGGNLQKDNLQVIFFAFTTSTETKFCANVLIYLLKAEKLTW
jgi:hypothetical protein